MDPAVLQHVALLQNKKRKGEEAEEDIVLLEVSVFFQIKAPELPGGKHLNNNNNYLTISGGILSRTPDARRYCVSYQIPQLCRALQATHRSAWIFFWDRWKEKYSYRKFPRSHLGKRHGKVHGKANSIAFIIF
jgi:hypothetical protein